MPRCRLCRSTACVPAGQCAGRELLHCPACGLVFVPKAQWLSVAAERERYAHHDNTAANEGYVRFLGEVADLACAHLGPGGRVLDFGSGPNAVLTGLLRARGHACVAYDPVYGVGADALADRYDAVVACEVIEHLREPRAELARITACLRPGGSVVVRTRCYPSVAEIPSWWYARDLAHINFFGARTLDVGARLCGLSCRRTSAPDIFVWSP